MLQRRKYPQPAERPPDDDAGSNFGGLRTGIVVKCYVVSLIFLAFLAVLALAYRRRILFEVRLALGRMSASIKLETVAARDDADIRKRPGCRPASDRG